MKKLSLIFATMIGLSGCVAYDAPISAPNKHWRYDCTEYCDQDGSCHNMCDTYYYGPDGTVFYYDATLGLWLGPHGYWRNGIWVGHWNEYHHGEGFRGRR